MNKYVTTGNLIKVSLIFSLLTQISHAAFVFARISHDENNFIKETFAYIFAISLELSIYIFTMKGKKNSALAFGIISTLVNIFYYWYEVDTSLNFLSSVVVSLIVPVIIYVYSDVIQDEQKRKVGRPQGAVNKTKEPSVKRPYKKKQMLKEVPVTIVSEVKVPEAKIVEKRQDKVILKENVKKGIKKAKNL